MKKKHSPKNDLNKERVLSLLTKNEAELKSFGVKKIGIFGSFIRNEQHEESDIDFLVEFEKEKKTFRNFIGLAYYLEELFKKRVEIVTTEALSPYIGAYILEEVEYAVV